ncbi:hypothetical protein MHU86_8891 [Fragilaria crotonensis]|nr:hypothetical protein MHU86_8891 [Fragilaria crotonensis]
MKDVTADDGPPRQRSDGTSAPEQQDQGVSGHIHEQGQGEMMEPPTIVLSQNHVPRSVDWRRRLTMVILAMHLLKLTMTFHLPVSFLMSRSERKRHREKKRRNQVNAGFDDLKDLLLRIDPETNDRGDELNRVDLIGRAVLVMRKLINDNEALRRQRIEQESKERVNKRDDLVTIAVPYLVPKEHHYIPPAPQPLHHSTPHHAPPPPPQQRHHHLHPDDPPQAYHHQHQHHHQYQYAPPQQGPTHASSAASSSAQHQSHPASHHFSYHHHEGPTGHHPYYGDGYA